MDGFIFARAHTLCAEGTVCSDTLGCVECLDDTGCNDGLYCNGEETCDAAGACVDGTPPCDDTITCTVDGCNEDTDACSVTPNDTRCDDWLYCTGVETCDPDTGDPTTGCVPGTPVACDDGVDCTRDECSEATMGCTFTTVHTDCDVMAGEFCDPTLGCIVLECTSDAECDNDLACDGVETCVDYSCQGGTPVVCDDGYSCTDDYCVDPAGTCATTLVHSRCTDSLVCNGDETCDPATGDMVTGCADGTPPTCNDGIDCTDDSCSEAAGGCQYIPDDLECQDTDLCNGVESCNVAVGCVSGTPVVCDDSVGCTLDECIPLTGDCTFTPDDGECDNDLVCDGAEICDPTSDCLAGTPIDCTDSISCTVDTCVEPGGTCQNSPDHTLCDPGEVCLVPGGCTPGTACTDASDCQDGSYCNGAEVCSVAGVCQAGTPVDCDDDNPCTVDSCDDVAGSCVNEPRDQDGDGYTDELCGGTDCEDLDATIHPGAVEECDGIDNDCDGDVDGGLLVNGATCSASAECCSGLCAGGICTVGWALCEGLGDLCASSADCCSGHCEPNVSGDYTCVSGDACTLLGATCETSAECCSTLCQGGVCALGTCFMVGETCAASEECCSDDCVSTVCQDAGASCSMEGEYCTSDGNCCSGFCEPTTNRCMQYTICSPSGSVCIDDSDCCTNYCEYDDPGDDSGTCLFLGSCTVVGMPCSGGGECCSDACVDPGFGYEICVYLSGCRPIGELCNTNEDCCGGACEPDGPISRCMDRTPCQPDGEMCGLTSTNNCCSFKKDGCRPTVAGVWRCFGTEPGTCILDGDPCSFSDECCCGLCADDGAGNMVCCPGGVTCVEDGDPCTADMDCCSGYCNLVTGLCGADEDPCVELGGPCTSAADCCSGSCLDGFCAIIDT